MFEFPTTGNKHLDRESPKLISSPVYEVSYSWLEWLVKREYGHELCFVAAWECGNDTSHDMTVEAKVATEKYDIEDLLEFTEEGQYQYGTPHLVMNDLCSKGLLAPGRYIVDICW